mgnify:FL=1
MFNQSSKDFFTSKTNWTALTMIIVAIAGYIAKEYTLSNALTQALTGLGMLFIRDAIAKV